MSNLSFTKLITFPQSSASNDCDCACNYQKHHTPNLFPLATLTTAYLELTPACNNHCLGCGNVFVADKTTRKMENAAAPLPIAGWRQIIHKLLPHIDRLNITGGEPTLYKHFTEFTHLLDEYKLSFTLFTNARWRKSEIVVNTLNQSRQLKGLLVSLHGQNAPTHEAFTLVSGSFDETVKNIKLAIRAGISVSLCSIITRYSYAQSRAVYQLGQELGARQVVFNRYVGRPKDDTAPTPAQLKQALIDIEAMRVQGAAVKSSVTVPQCFHTTSATGCGAGEAFITVDPWGNVKPCNHSPLIIGRLGYDSLEKIMASKQLAYWRNLPLAGCKDCSALAICGGGCRAEAMLNQNSHDSLMGRPFLPEDKTNFLILPDYLQPVVTRNFAGEDFVDEVDLQLQDVLLTSLNGAVTLQDLGIKHGQKALDLIGAMHQQGVVEFV